MANPNIDKYGKATQFKPGQSGNPNGRPRGHKNQKTRIREFFEGEFAWKKVPVKNYKHLEELYGNDAWGAILYVVYARALSGDMKAIKWLSENAFGRPGLSKPIDSEERQMPVPIYGGLAAKTLEPGYGDPQYRVIPDKK